MTAGPGLAAEGQGVEEVTGFAAGAELAWQHLFGPGMADRSLMLASVVLVVGTGLFWVWSTLSDRRRRRKLANGERVVPAVKNAVGPAGQGRTQALVKANERLRREVRDREMAEEKILRHQVFLMTVIDSLAHPFLVVDARDFSVKLANKAAADRALGDPGQCFSLIHGFEQPCMGVDTPCVLKDIYRRRKPVRFEHRITDRQGRRIVYEVHGYPVFDEQGRVAQIIEYFIDVTERKSADEALRESEARFRNIYENSLVMMHSLDQAGRIASVNRKWLEEMGYTGEEVTGRRIDWFVTPESKRRLEESQGLLWKGGRIQDDVYQFITKGGELIDVLMSSTVTADAGGRRVCLSVLQNVSERRRAEQELLLAASVFENSFEGIFITDAEKRIIRVNQAFTAVTGYSADEVQGKLPSFLSSDRHDEMFFREMWNALDKHGFWQGEIWNRRKTGEVYPEWFSISTVYHENRKPAHYIGLFNDITEKKLWEERIFRLAHYDALTGLPNRVLFQDRLDRALVDAKRSGTSVPLLYLDLDRFKPINDSFGHAVGDLLLQQVADRLRSCVREADTVARMGGDEFTVILARGAPGQDGVQSGSRVARAILRALAEPFDLDGHEVFISTSIGIVVYPSDGRTSAELVKNADTAMYHAKSAGRSNFLFYEPRMNATAADRLLIENSLRRALDRGEFELYFQPCLSLDQRKIACIEVLLRWRHPEFGMIPPDRFIGLAEETGVIVPVGEWVLREALNWLSRWRGEGFGAFRVAVNLSLRQLKHSGLVRSIRSALDKARLDPTALALEVTESAFMEDETDVVAKLNLLSAMGIEILIDDFGTGYSSLARLRALPIHVLKIDRSFVRDITIDPNDECITAAIIAMAHSLQMQVIAEGVETVEQLKFLELRGCDHIQGFLFGRPIPATEVADFLRSMEHQRLAAK